MIEPEYAGRLGVSQHFTRDDRQAVERACARLQTLGIGHVRFSCSAEMFADGQFSDWFGWLVARLGVVADVLPSIVLGGSVNTYASLGNVLNGQRSSFGTVEFSGTDLALQEACAVARDVGLKVVLAVEADAAILRLRSWGDAGLLQNAAAIGLSASLDDMPALHALAGEAHRVIGSYNPEVDLWLTNVSTGAARYEHARQARLFIDLLGLPAERLYWPALVTCADERHDGGRKEACGLEEMSGQPTLLGRLLEGGVGEMQRILSLTLSKPPAVNSIRPILVTGGAGFIGANLADRLAQDGHHVLIYDALARPGVERNLRWLARRHASRISFELGDLRDEAALSEAASRVEALFHLAGQVAVTTSMVSPLTDFAVNARGTLALLEALRTRNPQASLIFASTNKVYGDLADIELVRDADGYVPVQAHLRAHGVDETRPLCFHTPYGCSKGAADQYVLDYAHSFGLRTAVFRMSCIYGERQLGTEDQGWVAHFLLRAIAGDRITIYGDGRQVRDVLHVGDAVSAYMSAWRNIDAVAGKAFNLGGGPANAISLLQLVSFIEYLLGRRVDVDFDDWRPGDQRYFVADSRAAQRDLSLAAALGWQLGLARLANHFGAMPTPAEATQ